LSRNLGTLTSWNPLGHPRPLTGLLYLLLEVVRRALGKRYLDSIDLGRETMPAFINEKHVTSSVMKRIVLSWAIMQCVVVIPHQLYRTNYRSLLQGSRFQEGKELPLHTA
jgi:diketogulonate reductase-like aldo/keto reductase